MTMDATVFQTMRISTQTATHPDVRARMTPVRFTGTCPPFHAGETAQFSPEHATQLIDAGLAVAA